VTPRKHFARHSAQRGADTTGRHHSAAAAAGGVTQSHQSTRGSSRVTG